MASMKKVFIAAMVIGFTFATIPVFAQSSKEAIYALKKLEARVGAGISYRDYSPALGEAKFPINLYLESQESKNNPELVSLIKNVMAYYEQAGSVFEAKLQGPYRYLDMAPISRSKEGQQAEINQQKFYNKLFEQYPEANKFIADGGALDRDRSNKGQGKVINLEYLVPIIWHRASVDLQVAARSLSKAQEAQNETEKLKKENEQLKATTENEKLKAENEQLKAAAENEKLRAENENEKLRTENERLKKQLESMTPKKKK